jgi:heat shock protein HtpX
MLKNTVKTSVLLAALGGLFVAIGGLLGGSGGATIGLLIGLVLVGGSYWFSDKLALKAARAQIVTEQQAPDLYRMVASLAQRADLPMPVVAISPALQPNAFATGRNPKHAVVCCTQGILQSLSRDELEGVLAHELMHVKHRDILIGSIAAAIATGISYAAQLAMFSAMFGGRDNDREGGFLGPLLVMLLAPIAAGLMQMAVSRSREFEADRGGAALLGTGEPLARALEHIETAAKQTPPMEVAPAQAYAWIHNPLAELKGSRNPQQARMAGLFSTHPPTAERIRRLRAMSHTH